MVGKRGNGYQTIDCLREAAAAGDREASAKLAQIFLDVGRWDEALPYMEAAAAAGHTLSAAQLGAWHIIGHLVDRDVVRGFRLVEQAARDGDVHSQTFLATLYAAGIGAGEDFATAVTWLVRAARAGHGRALRQLGFMVPAGDDSSGLKRSLLAAAAERGDICARFFLGKHMWRAGETDDGLAILSDAARAGDPAARLFLTRHGLVASSARPAPGRKVDVSWNRVGETVRAPLSAGPLNEIILKEKPRISTFRGLLNDDLCDYMISAAAPYMRPATVNDAERGMEVPDPSRTNTIMGFYPIENDVVVQAVYRRIAAATGFPIANGEVLGVLRYMPGQRYAPHYDFFDPAYPVHATELDVRGQRIKTVLVYLNEDYSGGETLFNRLDWKFRGARGDALIFANVGAEGEIDRLTLHTGLTPTSGEKWLISLWVRDRAQR